MSLPADVYDDAQIAAAEQFLNGPIQDVIESAVKELMAGLTAIKNEMPLEGMEDTIAPLGEQIEILIHDSEGEDFENALSTVEDAVPQDVRDVLDKLDDTLEEIQNRVSDDTQIAVKDFLDGQSQDEVVLACSQRVEAAVALI